MSIDASKYTITIQKVKIEDDYLFEATIKELPDVVDYGETHDEAYTLAIETIEDTAEMLKEDGIKMPSPCERQDNYSGRVTLRLPKSLHKQTAQLAELDGVSLNGFVVSVLSERIGIEPISHALKELSHVTKMLVISASSLSESYGENPIIKIGTSSESVSTSDNKEQVLKYG